MAVLVLCGAALVLPIAGPAAPPRSAVDARRELVEGFRVLRREPAARLLVGLLGSQYVAIGMLDVLYVVLAIETLGMGQGGAGYLNAAFGAGGALGIAITASLVGRARLMPAVVTVARRLGRRLRGDGRLVAGCRARCCCSRSPARRAACSTLPDARSCSGRRPPTCWRASSGSSRR